MAAWQQARGHGTLIVAPHSATTGLQHAAAAVPFEVNTLSFLANLFAGGAPGSNCSPVGSGTSIAPLPKPHQQ